MNCWTKIGLGWASACAALLFSAAEAAQLLDVRFGPSREKTRVVFDLAGPAAYAVSGEETGKGRLIIDFADLSVAETHLDYRPGKGHVARYGFARRAGGGARAILDFKKTAAIQDVFMIEPAGAVTKHRLVVDLETAAMPAFIASIPARYPDLASVIEEATAAPETTKPSVPAPPNVAPAPGKGMLTVVIDPGHGGADPGAQGQSGTLEKRVTLAAALELAEILKKRDGYEVVLTREGDAKIKPDRREALAREVGANLFISLHADAIRQSQVRGGSVYTLSEEGSARSAKLAKSEGNYHVYDLDTAEYAAKYGEAVSSILMDKAQDETSTASSYFAKTLIKQLSGKTPLLNRSHRKGDLRVLLAPDVPAVLFEMAFISNAKDEANLNSPVWRRRTMTAVADAIDAYFEEHGDRKFAQMKAAGAK